VLEGKDVGEIVVNGVIVVTLIIEAEDVRPMPGIPVLIVVFG
jgi:hypothetical protein